MASRNSHVVAEKYERKTVTKWIVSEVSQSGTHYLISKNAVDRIVRVFTQKSRNAALEKARKWIETADKLLASLETPQNRALCFYATEYNGIAKRRGNIKARVGRERSSPNWKYDLNTGL